jgi:hypothetical protein
VDRVVYLLGAGFSAPLGLPVMSNFLMKSKDLFEPQQTFIIVSQESVEMPDDHVCYAMPKTGLCNKGIAVPGAAHLALVAVHAGIAPEPQERGLTQESKMSLLRCDALGSWKWSSRRGCGHV